MAACDTVRPIVPAARQGLARQRNPNVARLPEGSRKHWGSLGPHIPASLLPVTAEADIHHQETSTTLAWPSSIPLQYPTLNH